MDAKLQSLLLTYSTDPTPENAVRFTEAYKKTSFIDTLLKKPLPAKELYKRSADKKYGEVVETIALCFSSLFPDTLSRNAYDEFLDFLSDSVISDGYLREISYTLIGADGDTIYIQVEGYLDMDDIDEWNV